LFTRLSSIPELLRARAGEFGTAPAISCPGRRSALTYAALADFVERTATALATFDLQPSDRIALTGPNGPEMATAFLAVTSVASCAPLNPAYTSAEFRYYLSDLAPRAILMPEGSADAARTAASELNIAVIDYHPVPDGAPGVFTLPSLCGEARPRVPGSGEEALVLHTSGTTSRPKQVPLSHANLLHSAATVSASLQLAPSDRCLNVMPLFHVHGLVAALLASVHAGASLSCSPGFVPPRFWEWIAEEGATWYTAAPTIHQAALAQPSGRHRLRFVRSCSAPLAPALSEALEQKLGVPVIEAYGMTEAAHQMASNPLPPGIRKPGSVGRATGCEITILDEAGRVLPEGTCGGVAIRGPNVTQGYCNNPEANASSFTNGWFRTGDEGYLDADGYLFLTGRTKELINRGGEKIAPREIDEVLLQHPAVAQALAFSLPHFELGETVAAAVVLKSRDEKPDLRAFAMAKLSYFKVPERIVFLDDLPKGPTGKPQRIGLAAKLELAGIDGTESSAAFVAPRNDTEAALAVAMGEVLHRKAPVGIQDNFFSDLGGTSLSSAALLARVAEFTGVAVKPEQFFRCPTVEGLQSAVLDSRRREDGFLIPIRERGSLPPLLCVPGSHGDLSGFHHLARVLHPERPVYAFRMPPAEGEFESYSVEHLAERYWSEWNRPIEAIVLGVCTGGPIALEMTQRIQAAGGTVPLVILFDSYNQAAIRSLPAAELRSLRLKQLRQRVRYQWNVLRESSVFEYAKPRVEAFLRVRREEQEQEEYRQLIAAGEPLPEHLRNSTCASRDAVSRHVPRPWNGRGLLLRVEEPRYGGYDMEKMGWSSVLDRVTLRDIPGGHLTALADPYVSYVGRCIEEEIPA
jgi:oxalate---CoA ligase